MREDLKLPVGVLQLSTSVVNAKHTMLTEIVNGRTLKRLVVVEPEVNVKRRLHRHSRRDEYIYLLSGNLCLTVYDGKTYSKIPMNGRGGVVAVARGVWHGYETGNESTVMIEASTEAFDPLDVEEFMGKEPV